MKISVNEEGFFELSEVQRKVICNDIREDEFEADMKRRLYYIIMHKYEKCLERLKQEWLPKLKSRVDFVPTNDDALVLLIFSQPDYKCRKTREIEENNSLKA